MIMFSKSEKFPLILGYYSFNHMKRRDLTKEYLSWLNDKFHMRWSNQRVKKHTKLTSKKFLDKHDKNENLFLSINYRNEMIGTVTIYIDGINKVGTAGILISNKISGQGYGKVAWNLLVNQISILLDLRKIKVGVAEGNFAMRNIIEHSGMKLEAVLKDDLVFDDFTADLLIYSKFFN